MSIFRWTALLAFCCICTACGGSDDTPAPVLSTEQVAGIWKLKSWTGEAQNPDGTSYTFSDVVYVYVELHEDNTYALYQNVSAVGAVKFTGSYSLEASTIRGFYSTSAGSQASERRGRDFRIPAPFICLGIQRIDSFSEQSGRPLACHVRTQTNNRRYAQRTIAPPCEKAGRRTDSGCAVENAGASLSAQHFRHGRRRFPDVSPGRCFWHHLLPLKSQRLSTKSILKHII